LILKNLDSVEKKPKTNPALFKKAKEKSEIIVTVALKLIDPSVKANETINNEVNKIIEAKTVGKPKWLGPPDDSFVALDYSRYKPRGFYTKSDKLKNYFRAMAWLQSIPFRVNYDDELLAILILGDSVSKYRSGELDKYEKINKFYSLYNSFLGNKDNFDLIDAESEAYMRFESKTLEQVRQSIINSAKEDPPKINDRIAYPQSNSNQTAELDFRVFSPYLTPDAMLFQKTTDRKLIKREFPDGLEICIALGSDFAKEKISSPQKKELLKIIEKNKHFLKGNSLYFDYLNTLKTLLKKPESDAPDFMKSDAWNAKSCNTVLAGWAQLRHTWALQAKQTICYLCGLSYAPRGFVEPNPDFWGKMANLAAKTKKILKKSNALNDNYDYILSDLINFKNKMKDVDFNNPASYFSPAEAADFGTILTLLMAGPSTAQIESVVFLSENVKWLDTVINDIQNNNIDKQPKLKAILQDIDVNLEDLWTKLEIVSRRLEVIAHKQLRKVEFNESENEFIKNYGVNIAEIMLYGGNSYSMPKDDAPRIVDVFANPERKEFLCVGISRPRKIFVLYHWKGENILCVGAVLPYYEFISKTRLTDGEWKKILDSKDRPHILDWQKEIINGGNLEKPYLNDLLDL